MSNNAWLVPFGRVPTHNSLTRGSALSLLLLLLLFWTTTTVPVSALHQQHDRFTLDEETTTTTTDFGGSIITRQDEDTSTTGIASCSADALLQQDDVCEYAYDLECDVPINCPSNSDCFDCDPFFLQYSSTDCDTCIANGGAYCVTGRGRSVCSAPEIVAALGNVCETQFEGGTAYVTTCPAKDDPTHAFNYVCDLALDDCPYQFNGICDAANVDDTTTTTGRCAAGTDCFDCSPCHAHRFGEGGGCDACTAAGCRWCAIDAVCFPALALELSNETGLTCTADDFVSVCPAKNDNTDNVYEDSLYYGAMDWLYEMINVKPVWEQGITGAGIGVRINDNGVDGNHPDLVHNFDVASSCADYYLPLAETDTHGTACAALAAASGGNRSCTVGVAPGASLSSCRIFDENMLLDPTATFEYRFLYENQENVHISSNSYGQDACYRVEQARRQRKRKRQLQTGCPFLTTSENSPCASTSGCGAVTDWEASALSPDCVQNIAEYCRTDYEADYDACISYLDLFVDCEYNAQSVEEETAMVQGITAGRGGLGMIYVYASGNEYGIGEDVNFEGSLNSRYTISVGGVGKDGLHASYSSTGAALFLTAPGGDVESYTGMIVPLPGGGCHDIRAGSSFAAPVASGVIALMLQANPNLSWRDVQGVLARTSRQVDTSDDSWTTNAAGFHHSYKYGFGVIDAGAAVTAAQSWINFSTEVGLVGQSGEISLSVPEFANGDVLSTINLDASEIFVTESVTIYVNLTHASRGDLELILISPSGTESILHPGQRPENQQGDERWKLTTLRNWGESANGDWQLRITDQRAGDLSECADLQWSILFGGQTLDCQFFVLSEACVDGAQGSGFFTYLSGVSDLNAVALRDLNGVGPSSACCVCGGGMEAELVEDVLESWRLEVFGHEADFSPVTSNSPPTAVAPSLSSPATAIPTTGFGGATIDLPPTSAPVPPAPMPASLDAPSADAFGGSVITETAYPATPPSPAQLSSAAPLPSAPAKTSFTPSPSMPFSFNPPTPSSSSSLTVSTRTTLASRPTWVLAAAFAVFAYFS